MSWSEPGSPVCRPDYSSPDKPVRRATASFSTTRESLAGSPNEMSSSLMAIASLLRRRRFIFNRPIRTAFSKASMTPWAWTGTRSSPIRNGKVPGLKFPCREAPTVMGRSTASPRLASFSARSTGTNPESGSLTRGARNSKELPSRRPPAAKCWRCTANRRFGRRWSTTIRATPSHGSLTV